MSGATDSDVILGALKLVGKADCQCFTGIPDFLKAFPKLFAVEIPASITNVIVSVDQPDDSQLDCVWFRLSPSGSFSGIFIYATGDWQQIWPVPNAVFKMYGDSRSIPAGYALVDANNPHFTAGQIAAMRAVTGNWIQTVDLAAWAVFEVTYEGF